jgi:simple sugar transport system permease protein
VKLGSNILAMRELGPVVGLAIVALVFEIASGGRFFSPELLSASTSLAASVGTIGVGVTLLMISGEFDLSVSAVYAFAPIAAGQLMASGVDEVAAFLAAMALSAAIGLMNGLVTTRFHVPSFITTLGSLLALTGINFAWTGGYPIPHNDKGALFSLLGDRIAGSVIYFPAAWMIVWAVVVWFILQRTRYGNWTLASGGRTGVARAMGVPVWRVKTTNFVICSVIGGFAGCTQFAQLGIVSAGFGENFNLLAIVAAVIGGASLFGVIGSVPGTIIGALILGSLQTGLVLIGAPSSYYTAFIGLILILVVIANIRLERYSSLRAARARIR